MMAFLLKIVVMMQIRNLVAVLINHKNRMTMKQILFKKAICLSFIMGLLSMSAVLVSCSSDDDPEPDNKERADGRKLRQLTISDVSITRAMLTDNTNTLGAAWKAGDQATYFNLTSFDEIKPSSNTGYLTAHDAAATSTFTGTVRCDEDDYLALFYPAKELTMVRDGSTLNYKPEYTINLTGQTGTLENIANNYHYIYGVGQVTSVTDNTATATISGMKPPISGMKPLLAVCKFTFKNKTTDAVIPVNTLQISYGYDLDAGFPQTYALMPKVNPDEVFVPANLSSADTPLTINLGTGVETTSGVYVALFPVTDQTLFFSVTNSTGTYTGTATAKLNASKYYPVTLKLTKQ